MKIIFLDFDGVLCIGSNWGSRDKKIKKWKLKNPNLDDSSIPSYIKMDNFDTKAVKVLNDILSITDAEIVVSSDWKLYCTLKDLQDMFQNYGVLKSPIGTTSNHILKSLDEVEINRVGEISEWLETHPEVEKWVAIDDLDLSSLKNFVHTKRMFEGIKECGIKEKILKYLL